MRLSKPRVLPLEDGEMTPEVREIVPPRAEGGRPLNIFTTIARHPKLLKRWLVFGSHILGKSTLSPRARELLILRTGWLCRSEYEWGQHAAIGRMVGITEEELRRITKGPDEPGWDPLDANLLQAADQLHEDSMIGNATWAALSAVYDTRQMLDVVFTVGQYTLVSMVLNTLGVQLDEGIEGFPR